MYFLHCTIMYIFDVVNKTNIIGVHLIRKYYNHLQVKSVSAPDLVSIPGLLSLTKTIKT